jgi:hypothetical protein
MNGGELREEARYLRRLIEHALAQRGWGWDALASLLLDRLQILEDAMNERLSVALTPDAFDYASCALCQSPTAVPLSWILRPRGSDEPDAPQRWVMHDACSRRFAEIPDDEAA